MPPWFFLCLECSDGVGRYKYLTIAAFITIYTLHGFVSVIRSDLVISALVILALKRNKCKNVCDDISKDNSIEMADNSNIGA